MNQSLLFLRVAAGVLLGDARVEALLLFGREQGADARARGLADGVEARARLGAQRAVLAVRLVEYLAHLGRLPLVEFEVAPHPLEDALGAAAAGAPALPRRAGAQAVGAVEERPRRAAEREDDRHRQPELE